MKTKNPWVSLCPSSPGCVIIWEEKPTEGLALASYSRYKFLHVCKKFFKRAAGWLPKKGEIVPFKITKVRKR